MRGAMSRATMRGWLAAVPLFAELQAAELDALAASATAVKFRKGLRVFEEGQPADSCFVLTAGRGRVVLSGDGGNEILLHIVRPPDLVGEIALLDGATRSASLVVTEDCHAIQIPAASLALLRRNPAFEQRLISTLVATLRESDDRVRVIATFPSINRVAWCLAQIARYEGTREGGTITIPRIPDHALGEMAGCTRETVNRALNELKKRKFVTWDAQTMRLDVAGMQRYLTTELTVPGDRRRPVR